MDGDIVLTFSEPVYPEGFPDYPYAPIFWGYDGQNHVSIRSVSDDSVTDFVSVVGDRDSGWGTSTITIDRSGNPGGLMADTA